MSVRAGLDQLRMSERRSKLFLKSLSWSVFGGLRRRFARPFDRAAPTFPRQRDPDDSKSRGPHCPIIVETGLYPRTKCLFHQSAISWGAAFDAGAYKRQLNAQSPLLGGSFPPSPSFALFTLRLITCSELPCTKC
jgi:hypothetical protein